MEIALFDQCSDSGYLHKYTQEENNFEAAALNGRRPVCCLNGCGCNDMCNNEVYFFEGIPEHTRIWVFGVIVFDATTPAAMSC